MQPIVEIFMVGSGNFVFFSCKSDVSAVQGHPRSLILVPIDKVKVKVKAVDLYSAYRRVRRRPAVKPPLMRSRHGLGAAGHTSHCPQRVCDFLLVRNSKIGLSCTVSEILQLLCARAPDPTPIPP